MAMAHTVSDKVEAAYRRGDMRGKSGRRLMADWAAYCASPPTAKKDNVVPMRSHVFHSGVRLVAGRRDKSLSRGAGRPAVASRFTAVVLAPRVLRGAR